MKLIDDFHAYYFGVMVSRELQGGGERWMGVPIRKCPLDLWVYQEMIFELRPDIIVETGTYFGGSALFFAHMCDIVGNGRVMSVDIADRTDRPEHGRIEYVTASSVDAQTVERIADRCRGAGTTLVILDSDHRPEHVYRELVLYAPLVTRGSYIVVEDTNMGGHPIAVPDVGGGPREAVERFLTEHDGFEVDRSREKLLVTFNPGGFLRRVR